MKNILIGITGSISAYKIPDLCRLLTANHYNIKIILTHSGSKFVSPLTLNTLSNNNLFIEDSLQDINIRPLLHIELAKWADIILIAPCSANTLAKIANGYADNLLTSTTLASDAKLLIAPSMNKVMWENKATKANCKILQERNIKIIYPEYGEQACGDVGEGRLANINYIYDAVKQNLYKDKILKNKNIIITAGGTIENIDPVRCISNHSSGKMGYYLAKAAKNMGANVKLIISSTAELSKIYEIDTIYIKTSDDMYNACVKHIENTDIFISAAAVCDFKPKVVSPSKMKKTSNELTLKLEQTIDIVKSIKKLNNNTFVVGFAAETENLIQNAKNKLNTKNLDMIIANDVSCNDSGFFSDHNAVNILTKTSNKNITLCHKQDLSYLILEEIHFWYQKKHEK